MTKIGLEGMKFYAYHGVFPQENEIGTEFIMDVHLEYDAYNGSDELVDTFDYAIIYNICQAEMSKTYKLIESVAYRVAHQLKGYEHVSRVCVSIRKKNPPIDGILDCSLVEISI